MNIANKLTLSRVAMIPAFLFLFWFPPFGVYGRYAAAGVFILAAFTDYLDGALARRYGLITNFGKFMDPLADKLMVCAALVALTGTGEINAWVTIFIVSREFIVTGVRLIAAEQGVVIAADRLAKLKTVVQIITVAFYIFGFQNLFSFLKYAGFVLLGLTVLLTVASACGYIIKNIGLFKKGEL